VDSGNNSRADGRSYLTVGAGATGDNIVIDDGGLLTATTAGWKLTKLVVNEGGAYTIKLDNDTILEATVDGYAVSWDGTNLNGLVYDGSDLRSITFADGIELGNVYGLVINASGYNAGTGINYYNTTVNATFNVGEGNTYETIAVNDAVMVMYSSSTINELTVNGTNSFQQFTTGTTTNVNLLGGKIELAGSTTMSDVLVDGTLFHTEIGDTADNSADHQTTQLVAYAAGVTVNNLTLQSGGSAFFYNGATANGITVEDGGVLYLTNWALSDDTAATVNGDLAINAGGTLYMGGSMNAIENIETQEGAVITGVAGGTTIDKITLRGVTFELSGLQIENATLDGNQTISGDIAITNLVNSGGALTITEGRIDNYSNAESTETQTSVYVNGGEVSNLDLTNNNGVAEINGGAVLGGTLGEGTLTDANNETGLMGYVSAFQFAGGEASFTGTELYDITVTGGTLTVDEGAILVGATATGGTIYVNTEVSALDVTSASVSIGANGKIDGITAEDSVITAYEETSNVILNNANISGTGNGAVVQAAVGSATNVTMNGGKYEALGNHYVDGITVDGTDLDESVRNQFIAWAADVKVNALTLQNGASAFFYNGATLLGATVNDGGILYLTDRNKTEGTVANISGTIAVQSGGELYIGSVDNVFDSASVIQTYGGSTITMVDGVTLEYIVLRGANIDINDTITINRVLQGGNQSVDGGTIGTWQNNYGVLTVNDGTIDTYIHNNSTNANVFLVLNDGVINNLNLTAHAGRTKLYGGVVNSATIGGGTVSDSNWADAPEEIVYGAANISNVTITGGALDLHYNGSVADNVTVNGGTLWIGRRDGSFVDNEATHEATATNVTMIAGTTRVDANVTDMVMSAGTVSMVGGTLSNLDIYGGSIVNWVGETFSGTINNAVVHASASLNGASFIWNDLDIQVNIGGYIAFGAKNTINDLKTINNVSIAAGSLLNGALIDSGAVLAGYAADSIYNDLTFKGEGTWAQLYAGTINNVSLYDKTKLEAGNGVKLYGAVVDADGVEVEFGDHKVGAHLGVYGADAYASGVTLVNHGSATIFRNGTIEDFTATDGGALYMRGWSVATSEATGVASNGTISSTGGIWFAGGTLKDVTIEYGAWKNLDYSALTVYNNVQIGQEDSTYLTVNFSASEGGNLVLNEGDVFYGNYAAGGGSASMTGTYEITMSDKATLMGWNLGTAKVTGQVVLDDGSTVDFYMGQENSYGGVGAKNIYLYNGCAVLGTGAKGTDEAGEEIIKYNSVEGLTVTGGDLIVGNNTMVTDVVFSEGVSLQTYGNANIVGVNLDEEEDSIYRNFSLYNGVASGLIIENGGSIVFYNADFSYSGSPANHAQDMIVRGSRTTPIGNYSSSAITTYGGGSYIYFEKETSGDNITVGTGAVLRVHGTGVTLTNVALEEGAVLMIDALDAATAISGTNSYGEFSINGNAINGLAVTDSLTYVNTDSSLEALEFGDLHLANGAAFSFAGATVNGMTIENYSEYYAFGLDNTVSDLTVSNAKVNFAPGSGVFNNVTLTNNSLAVMYGSATINNLTIDEPLTWAQIGGGVIDGLTLTGGKLEAIGSANISNIVIDGTNYHTEIGDCADNSEEHQTTQLVAYAMDVSLSNLVVQSGGSAFVYNNAYINGNGDLTVSYANGAAATTSAGVVVEDGGVLYFTNWALSEDIDGAYVEGDLWINGGGTLYLGTKNFYVERIQTMAGATITGIADGTYIESMILRGANIDIDEKLSIGNVIQGAAQSIDGGAVGTWTNNYGVLTLNSGSIDTYISNNAANGKLVMNDGSIGTLDLSKSTAVNYIAGGEVGSLVISSAGGVVYDLGGDSVGSGATINNAVINGQGGYVPGTWSWNGGTLNVRNDNTVVNGLELNGGLAQIGNSDQGYNKATANNVTANNTTIRVDAIVNDLTLNASTLSIYGGTVNGLNAYSGSTIANYGNYTGTIKNASFFATEDSNTAVNIAGAKLVDWSDVFVGEGFNGYTIFGSGDTINSLYAYSNVNVGNCTTVTNVEMYDGSILVNYGSATINGLKFYGDGTWAQVTGGVTSGLELYDTTKYECAGTNVVSGAVVDAFGVDVEFKEIKVGAHLVVYAAGASATDVTLINKGSATVYNGATIENVVASEGGALYMVDWYGGTPATPGTANNVTITATGALWYKGGTMNNLTIESGATLDMTVKITDTINGTYSGISGIGNLGYDMAAGTGSFVAVDGVTFVGSYTAAGGVSGSVNLSSLWLFEGASMVGWNLGASTVSGYYVDGEGEIHKLIMGGTNEYGGKHAQNVYFYNGSAVLGTGSVSGDVVAYNTATGLIFDNSLFVLGNNTIVEDTIFRNGTSIQTYGNATLSGVNEDEAEDSVYRNFSIKEGVVSNFIVENGSFIQGMKYGNNWSTSPATSYQNVLVRGARTEAAGNYNASMMETYGGGSYITVTNGSDSDGITIEEGAFIVTQDSGDGAMIINNLTIAEGGNFIFNNLKSDTMIEGTYADNEFFVANGMVSGLVLDSDKLSVTAVEAMEFNNVRLTAGTLNLSASGNILSGDNYIGMDVDAANIGEISGTLYLDNVEFTLGGGAADCSNLTQLTVDGGTFSTTDNDMRNASVTITNGAKATWAGGSLGSDSVVTVSGEGTTLNMSWQHADWGSSTPTMNITDGATANFGTWNCFGTINVDNGGLYVSASGGKISQVNLNDGWVQFDGTGNTYSGNVTVTGTSSTSYYQLIGNQTGTVTLKGEGAVYVGSGTWGAGNLDGGITVTTGSKEVGNVSLRNGSLTGLNMNGGTFWYNGSYYYSDTAVEEVYLEGDVSFKNAIINSGEDNTITVDLTNAASLALGNYVEVNASVDATNVASVVLGANGSIAEGKTVTVSGINAFDFTSVTDFTVSSLLATNGDQFVVADGGEILIDTITVSNVEGRYILGDASYLDIDGGITVNVGTYVVNVTDYNTKFYTGASYSVTMTCEISVDDNNLATLTVYRTSSDEKVEANWPEAWTNAPSVNIEVTADDVSTYAVDGVLGLQECGPAAQVKFMYRDPATATNNNLALIGEECDGLYVVAGMVKPNQWGGRANTWIEVDGAQRITLIGGGTAEGGSISNATNLYITGEDTTATVYGGGGYGFTVANTNIVVDGATINRMYGGGYADGNWSAAKEITGQSVGGDVTGNVSIVTNNATMQRVVVGGGYGNVGGNISIELNDSVKTAANVYGGTFNTTADTTVGGDVDIAINGGEFSGMFVGGSYVAGAVTSTIKGDVSVSVSGATQLNAYRPDFSQTAWVIGGGYAVSGGSIVVEGSTNLVIDGSVVNNIIGGGAANEAGCTTSVGATNVTISNSLVTGDVFGGAYAYNTGVSSVLGDANLTIDTTSAMVTIIGNVYAGGKGANSAVLGNATVTFTGNADLLNYNGTISGDGNYTAVEGDSIVSFANFYGEYSLNTVDFNLIKFSGDTTVTITSDTISGIDSLNFDLSERSADLSDSAVLTGGSFEFTEAAKLNVAGVAGLESSASFVLMDEIADVDQIGDATIELEGLGSFAVGGSLDVEGYGIFTAVIDEVGALTLSFELEAGTDGDGAIKKSLLA